MEFRITDLMDHIQDASVELKPNTAASESRIKELTMKKVQNRQGKYASLRRGIGFIGKVLIAAAIIAALAIPVMAVSGLIFSDWQEEGENPINNGYDDNILLGAEYKKWDVSGWVLQISAEYEDGLTLICQEMGTPENFGTLEAWDGWWLEKWNGSEYIPIERGRDDSVTQSILPGEEYRWEINWEELHGELESGSYRVGKNFTYTNEGGEAENMAFYAKFRVFTRDMVPYLDQYRAAYNALHEKESYHITHTQWPGRDNGYEYYVTEIWRDGDNYLSRVTYYLSDGSILASHGLLRRDGMGYTLEWKEFDVFSAISEWSKADWVAEDNFDLWFSSMDVREATLGEICVEENALRFYSYHDFIDETNLTDAQIAENDKDYPTWNHDYTEMAYTFGEGGAISRIERTKMRSLDLETADPVVDAILEVHDTSRDEITKIIAAQDVTNPPAFSWTEDQATYADIGIKEGFRNTSAKQISTAQEAIDRAKKEIDLTADPDYREGYEYNVTHVYHDKDADMWKVTFEFSQDDYFMFIVYLNSDGTTQMTVYP